MSPELGRDLSLKLEDRRSLLFPCSPLLLRALQENSAIQNIYLMLFYSYLFAFMLVTQLTLNKFVCVSALLLSHVEMKLKWTFILYVVQIDLLVTYIKLHLHTESSLF